MPSSSCQGALQFATFMPSLSVGDATSNFHEKELAGCHEEREVASVRVGRFSTLSAG
eukprot:m.364063 g.364063  ORF g.364063 m.364063 type:complete len:57 (+) comp56033_c1_seq20:743-913(+)